jgi:hypothetical protein
VNKTGLEKVLLILLLINQAVILGAAVSVLLLVLHEHGVI